MLDTETLAGILRQHGMIAAKGLHDAFERQQNVGDETLEESLTFLGLANYELLGKAYSLHYRLPYRPVFHPGIADHLRERFSPRTVSRFMVLPVEYTADHRLTMVTCQPDDDALQAEMRRVFPAAEIEFQVASWLEIKDAIQRYFFQQEIKREKTGIVLPFDFKIIDFEVTPSEVGDDSTRPDAGNRQPDGRQGKKIVLVEPDHEIRHALQLLLSREGYQVTAVIDAGEAVKALESQDAVYLLKRRAFHSRDRQLEQYLEKNRHQVEIRHYSALGSLLLGEELSSEQIFRTFLSTVRLLLAKLAHDNPELLQRCDRLLHYARLLSTAVGMKRKSQEALQLAIYLKEIGRYSRPAGEGEAEIFSLVPLLPYESSATVLEEIEDCFGLAAIIAGLNQPLTVTVPQVSRVLTLLLAFVELLPTAGGGDAAALAKRLHQEKPGVLDPEMVNHLVQIFVHEQRLAGLGPLNGRIVVLDPGFEREHAELYHLLLNEGYEVIFALTREQAWKQLQQEEVVLIISELAATDELDGLGLCRRLQEEAGPGTREVPLVFFTDVNDEEMLSQALLAGAADVISKGSGSRVALLKMTRLIKRHQTREGGAGNAGVTGSLAEMGFMETVQILANRAKDALISMHDADGRSARVYLHNGEIIHAVADDLAGEEAIYALLTWKEGFFSVETPKQLPERNVFGSTEAIMLEGCRLLDEESREASWV